MQFTINKDCPRFIKGVVFGDSGSGKSTFAMKFVQKSCEIRGINNVLLIDTENGWSWLKSKINDINIFEPQLALNEQNILECFRGIKEFIQQNEISCIVIDSITHIGQLIGAKKLEAINEANLKKNPDAKPIEDLRYNDWNDIRKEQEILLKILREAPCDVLLCGRATSDSENGFKDGKPVIKKATSREVQGWAKITYEFDFTILANVDFDITKEQIKTFEYLVIKSRIANDGEKIKSIDSWFDLIKVAKITDTQKERHNHTIAGFETVQELQSFWDYIVETYGYENAKKHFAKTINGKKVQLLNKEGNDELLEIAKKPYIPVQQTIEKIKRFTDQSELDNYNIELKAKYSLEDYNKHFSSVILAQINELQKM